MSSGSYKTWTIDVSLLYSLRTVQISLSSQKVILKFILLVFRALLSYRILKRDAGLFESIVWMIIFDDFQIFSNVLQGLKLERERLLAWLLRVCVLPVSAAPHFPRSSFWVGNSSMCISAESDLNIDRQNLGRSWLSKLGFRSARDWLGVHRYDRERPGACLDMQIYAISKRQIKTALH